MAEKKFFTFLDVVGRTMSYGNDGSTEPTPDPLNNLGQAIRYKAVHNWINSGATVGIEAMFQGADDLRENVRQQVYTKPHLGIILEFCNGVTADIYEKDGETVNALIKSSWPQILNWAVSRKGFENSLVAPDKFERFLVKEFILFYSLKTSKVTQNQFNWLKDKRRSAN